MKMFFNIPTLRKHKDKQKIFYRDLFNLEISDNIESDDVRVRMYLCEKISNAYLLGDTESDHWVPILGFVIEKNFPSFCRKLQEENIKFIYGIKAYSSCLAKILDPCGNILSIYCDDDTDENGVDLNEIGIFKELS